MQFERVADKNRLAFIVAALQAGIPENGAILDIGCGNGIITRSIGESGYQVTGIDSSEKTIATARMHNTLPNVEFRVVQPGERLSVTEQRYDAVICSEVLEHLQDPASLLDNIFPFLKDNGLLVVTVPNGRGPRELLVTRPIQYLQRKNNLVWKIMSRVKRSMGYQGITVQSSAEDLAHIQFFTRKKLEQLAQKTGFRIIAFSASNFIEQVFPFSLLARKSKWLQKADWRLAQLLPNRFSSGFMTTWKKKTV